MSLIEGIDLYLALLHEGPPEDDWERRVLDEHHLELDSLAPYRIGQLLKLVMPLKPQNPGAASLGMNPCWRANSRAM